MEVKVFIYLRQKLTVPFTRELKTVTWNYNRGFICAGGVDGSARLFKLHPESGDKASNNPFYMNSPLEGHGSTSSVHIARWNEYYQKLTTSDDTGMIIVWAPNQDNTWYEEMMNNRNRSVVVDMKWSHDGERVAIAYEDGQVIVGSVDGNRIWSKEVTSNLSCVAFNADSSILLLGLSDGDVDAYDSNGNFIFKVPMLCLDNVEIEAALATKDAKKDRIVSMEYYVPALKAHDPEPRGGVDNFITGPDFLPRAAKPDASDKNFVAKAKISPNRPRFAIAFSFGVLQLMKHEQDTQPIVIRERNTLFKQVSWSPDGTYLAVGALVNNRNNESNNVMFLMSAYGEKYQALMLPKFNFNCFAWKGDGLSIGCGIDNNLYLATIKPRYKWAYCNKTVIYCYEQLNEIEDILVFYETKMDEKYSKPLIGMLNIDAWGDYCVLGIHTNEVGGPYLLQICNSIGTPVDQQLISVKPTYLAMDGNVVVAASKENFVVWHYTVPRMTTLDAYRPASNDPSVVKECQVYNIDYVKENARPSTSRTSGFGAPKATDYIKSVCVGATFFLVSRESGALHKYSLPEVTLLQRHQLGYAAERMCLNCASNRLAVITTTNTFKLFDIRDNSTQVVPNFERKDVWDMKWDSDKEDAIAIMEKSRLHIIQGTTGEDPVPNNGYICSFKDLVVRTIEMQTVYQNPDTINASLIVDIEVKTLRKAKQLLDAGQLSEACVFIEKNSHPKLWSLLAQVAMLNLDFQTAETAFVRLRHYGGLCFVKRLHTIQSDALQKAEVLIFYGDLDAAEKIYLENDRRDLAIDMRRRMHDWRRILTLLQQSGANSNDAMMIEAWRHVGDYYAERQKWALAAKHYNTGRHFAQAVDCYIKLDDYNNMIKLSAQLPEGHEVLLRLAEHFADSGLCENAVECFIKSDKIENALDTCIRLNQWGMAVELSKKYHLKDVEGLLSKYASELTGNKEKTLAAVQLFRKAGKYLQAARQIFEIAAEESIHATALRLKKLYVLGAVLVEQYREEGKKKAGGEGKTSATAALDGMLEEDRKLSLADSKLIDSAWRGAEAWHFYMLTHKQLFEKQYDKAVKTCLVVCEYEDFVDPFESSCLLALTSVHAGQYQICSKAFMKIAALSSVPPETKEMYNNLAMQIFLEHQPYDTRDQKVECTSCQMAIPDCSLVCPNPNCNSRFPTCIASGRPLLDYQFWLCPNCKHRAYESEMQRFKYCPLCHFEI